jgi:hypothetical protein
MHANFDLPWESSFTPTAHGSSTPCCVSPACCLNVYPVAEVIASCTDLVMCPAGSWQLSSMQSLSWHRYI